jgi:ribosomal subunit interface protein
MKYSLSTDHITVTPTDQELIDKKLVKLEKLVHEPYTMDLRLTHDTHHLKGEVVTCIINIQQGKRVFHAERSSESIQTSLDEVVTALRHELEKAYKKR